MCAGGVVDFQCSSPVLGVEAVDEARVVRREHQAIDLIEMRRHRPLDLVGSSQTFSRPSALMQADQVADPLTVLRVLTDQGVDPAVVDHRSAEHLARALEARRVLDRLAVLRAVLGRVAVVASRPSSRTSKPSSSLTGFVLNGVDDRPSGPPKMTSSVSSRSSGRPATTSCCGRCAGSDPTPPRPAARRSSCPCRIRLGALGAGVST